jgi:hypothetical protein
MRQLGGTSSILEIKLRDIAMVLGSKNPPKLKTWVEKETSARKNHLSRNYERGTRRRWRRGRGQEVFKCENIM